MWVFVDYQHAGKPGRKVRDRGAWGDLNGDGEREYLELEAYWTGLLALKLMQGCYVRNIPSILLSDGWYGNRARRAATYTKDRSLYFALHFNAGGGGYGSCFFDYRSGPRNGPRLADLIAQNLTVHLPELDKCKAIKATPSDWTKNAYSTIKACPGKMIGICLEPAFIDNPAHAPIFSDEGLDRITVGVMSAIEQFGD